MKWFHASLCIVLCFVTAWLIMFKKEVVAVNPGDMNIILGFGTLLMAALFITFMIIEERNEEIEKLRDILRRSK